MAETNDEQAIREKEEEEAAATAAEGDEENQANTNLQTNGEGEGEGEGKHPGPQFEVYDTSVHLPLAFFTSMVVCILSILYQIVWLSLYATESSSVVKLNALRLVSIVLLISLTVYLYFYKQSNDTTLSKVDTTMAANIESTKNPAIDRARARDREQKNDSKQQTTKDSSIGGDDEGRWHTFKEIVSIGRTKGKIQGSTTHNAFFPVSVQREKFELHWREVVAVTILFCSVLNMVYTVLVGKVLMEDQAKDSVFILQRICEETSALPQLPIPTQEQILNRCMNGDFPEPPGTEMPHDSVEVPKLSDGEMISNQEMTPLQVSQLSAQVAGSYAVAFGMLVPAIAMSILSFDWGITLVVVGCSTICWIITSAVVKGNATHGSTSSSSATLDFNLFGDPTWIVIVVILSIVVMLVSAYNRLNQRYQWMTSVIELQKIYQKMLSHSHVHDRTKGKKNQSEAYQGRSSKEDKNYSDIDVMNDIGAMAIQVPEEDTDDEHHSNDSDDKKDEEDDALGESSAGKEKVDDGSNKHTSSSSSSSSLMGSKPADFYTSTAYRRLRGSKTHVSATGVGADNENETDFDGVDLRTPLDKALYELQKLQSLLKEVGELRPSYTVNDQGTSNNKGRVGTYETLDSVQVIDRVINTLRSPDRMMKPDIAQQLQRTSSGIDREMGTWLLNLSSDYFAPVKSTKDAYKAERRRSRRSHGSRFNSDDLSEVNVMGDCFVIEAKGNEDGGDARADGREEEQGEGEGEDLDLGEEEEEEIRTLDANDGADLLKMMSTHPSDNSATSDEVASSSSSPLGATHMNTNSSSSSSSSAKAKNSTNGTLPSPVPTPAKGRKSSSSTRKDSGTSKHIGRLGSSDPIPEQDTTDKLDDKLDDKLNNKSKAITTQQQQQQQQRQRQRQRQPNSNPNSNSTYSGRKRGRRSGGSSIGGLDVSDQSAYDDVDNSSPHHRSLSISRSTSGAERDDSPASETVRRSYSVSNSAAQLVCRLDSWNLDVFMFADETGGRPLYSLLWAVFTKYDFLKLFRIDRECFKNFAKNVESQYMDLPFHNCLHAADVVNSTNYILTELKLGEALKPLQTMAAILAAAVHDMRHPGRNNRFLQLIHHNFAIVYSDQNVLERMHLAEAFKLIRSEGNMILENLDTQEYFELRKLMINMVLATDLGEHFQMMTKMKNIRDGISAEDEDALAKVDTSFLLEVVIKAADIGHTAKEWSLHEKWSECIREEFFQQGDEEMKLGMTVSPFMNRHQPQNVKNQVGFFDFIILPLFEVMTDCFNDAKPLLDSAQQNYSVWKKWEQEEKTANASNDDSGTSG